MSSFVLSSIPPIDEILQILFVIALLLFGVCFVLGCVGGIIWIFLPKSIQKILLISVKLILKILFFPIYPIYAYHKNKAFCFYHNRVTYL